MKAEYVNPFVEASVNVFTTMLNCAVQRTGLEICDTFTPDYEVTGVIGLSGRASGDVVVSFEKCLALAATEALLGEPVQDLGEDVVDAIGEITNMIAGNAKAGLEHLNMTLALPTVVVGKNHSIRFPSKVKPLMISFESPRGNFNIKVGLAETTDASGGQQMTAGAAV